MNVLIVEDHPVFRETIEKILSNWFPKAAVVCVADGTAALHQLNAETFTHLMLDLQIADMDGFDVVDAAMRIAPDIRIITLTSHCNDFTIYRAQKRRVMGFVDKRVSTAFNIHQAFANVEAGTTYYSPIFQRLKSARINDPSSFDKILSDREIEILMLIAVPYTDSEIAAKLGISPGTVEKHRFNVLRKMSLTTTTELIRFARQRGIIHCPKVIADIAPHSEQEQPIFHRPWSDRKKTLIAG